LASARFTRSRSVRTAAPNSPWKDSLSMNSCKTPPRTAYTSTLGSASARPSQIVTLSNLLVPTGGSPRAPLRLKTLSILEWV